MASNFRETAAGQLIRLVSRNRLLRYPEEKADFQLPQCWIDLMNGGDPLAEVVQHPDTGVVSRVEVGGGPPDGETATVSSSSNDAASPETPGDGEARKHLPEETNGSQTRQAPSSKSDEVEVETKGKKEKEGPVMEERRPSSAASKGRTNSIATAYEQRRGSLGLRTTKSRADTLAYTEARLEADEEQRLNRRQTLPIVPRRNDDGAILVDWYYTDDPENPQNWSNVRRAGVTFIICLYTFVVYSSSAIYTTSELGIMEEFGVSQTRASLGLSIFVLGYGVGPLLFSPLSEMARIGRNLVYIASMFLFVVISIPAALPHDYAGLMVLRFLQGFFGSPCLAAGGATVGDMYSLMYLPYALIAWGMFVQLSRVERTRREE
jgi:DHA1 family multidrug resistance protein-like MFS transporter